MGTEVQSEYSERRNGVESEPCDEARDPDSDNASLDGGVDHQRLPETTATFASMAGHLVSPHLDAMVKNIVAPSVKLMADEVAKSVAKNLTRLPSPKIDLTPLYKATRPQASKVLLEFLRMSDLVTPEVTRSLALSVSADLSKALTSGSALASWRLALTSENRIEQLVQGMTPNLSAVQLGIVGDLRLTSGLTTRMSEILAAANPSHKAFVMPALLAYRVYADEFAVGSEHQLTMLRYAGRTVSGLSATDLLLDDEEGGLRGRAVAEVRQDLVEPWVSGPGEMREALFDRLMELDPFVPDLLRNAWHDVLKGGPAKLVTIATCAVEAIDRSLRSAAPDATVKEWAEKSARPRKMLFDSHSGRLTRAARIGFILRERPGDRDLLDAEEKVLVAGLAVVRGRLEAAKHASEGDIVGVQGHLMAAEAMLIQLFLA